MNTVVTEEASSIEHKTKNDPGQREHSERLGLEIEKQHRVRIYMNNVEARARKKDKAAFLQKNAISSTRQESERRQARQSLNKLMQ